MQVHASQRRRQQPGGAAPSVGQGSAGTADEAKRREFPTPSPQIIGELMVIAQRIGGDFKMLVSVGNPGEGSFFNPASCEITLDPVHIVHSPLFAKFVAGHEGSHRAITLNLTEVGMSAEEANFFLSHIGFHAGFNGCEDNAVNTWMTKVFPGMETAVTAVYNEMFCRPNVEVALPAIEYARQQLGYYPRFGHYISEIIRDWHTGAFSPVLDPDVERVLTQTIKSVRRYTLQTPNDHASYADKVVAMQRRMEIYRHEVWPALQKLVELDLKNEAEHQLLKEILELKEELKNLKKTQNGIRHQYGPQSDARMKQRVKEIEGRLDEIQKLGGESLLELDEAMEKMLRESAEKLTKKLDELHKRTDKMSELVESLEMQVDQLSQELAEAESDEQRQKISDMLSKKQQELADAHQALQDLIDQLGAFQPQGGGGGGAAIDMSKLSPETRQVLRDLMARLPQGRQQQLRGRAEQALKGFDDKVAEELEGKLNEGNPTHADRTPRSAPMTAHPRTMREYMKQIKKNFEIERSQLPPPRHGMSESPWGRALQIVGDQVTPLYLRLKRFLRPQADPAWEPDFASGGRLNLDRVMQSEADPRNLDRIWERRGVPRTFDYRFSFVVDISGSMQGEKAEETFKGLVVLAEVLERLEIPYEIACFGSFFCNLKAFSEKLTDPNRLCTAESLLSNGGGTIDAWALQCAYRRLSTNLGKDNFIVMMTDGESGIPGELAEVIANIKAEGKVRLLALGLGPGTTFVRNSYPHAVGNIAMRLTDLQRANGALEFLDVIAILLEDMVVNPGSYDA